MTPKSISSHLAPYSIFLKRKTTIAHAFASALAPSDEYDERKIEAALIALGQKNLKQLSCVYCERQAQTWDHLENLVKAGKLNGYGHQIGNLVPCCRDCNSQKGGKPFREFIFANAKLTETEKSDLIHRLETHLALARPIQPSNLSPEGQDALTKFFALQTQILGLMEEADKYAQVLRLQKKCPTEHSGAVPEIESPDSILPITLEPLQSAEFKRQLLACRHAEITTFYDDGRVEHHPWDASRFSETSNVRGNLRSRPEFRKGAWRKSGIVKVHVRIVARDD